MSTFNTKDEYTWQVHVYHKADGHITVSNHKNRKSAREQKKALKRIIGNNPNMVVTLYQAVDFGTILFPRR